MPNPTWLFVGAVYAGAVWLARKRVALPRGVALLFYLLVLVFLFKPMTQQYVNLPVDFLKTLPPWAYVTHEHRVQNSQLNDLALQIVPWAHQVRESWKSFTPPLWNPLSGSGYPLLASAQSSALSPLRLITLPLGLGNAFTAEASFKILIALTFTFLFCRRRGYSELASTIGAVAFGFSTFIVVWLHFPLITSACLLPAVLYFVDLIAEKPTYGAFAGAAIVWTAMLFGGHPETASHTFFIAFLYVIWIAVTERKAKFILTLCAALITAALLAAPFLAPFLEGLRSSKRYHELQANPPGAEVPYSDWPSAIVLLQPHFYGQIPHEKTWGPADAESITGFAGILGAAAWFVLLTHVIATRTFRSREFFFVLATIAVLGVILAWPGFSETFHLAFKLAANARLRLLLVLLLAIQAAAAVDLLQRGHRKTFLTGIACAAALLAYVFFTSHFDNPYERDTAMLAMIPSLGVLVTAIVVAFEKRALPLLLAAAIIDVWAIGKGWNPVVPAKLMYPETPILAELRKLQAGDGEPFRMVGTGPMFFPNVNAVYGFEDIRAHDPMANGRYLGILRVNAGYDVSDYFAKWNNVETPLLDYLNVRYVLTGPIGDLDPARYERLYKGRDGQIFENKSVLPRFYPVRNVFLEFDALKFRQRLVGFSEYSTGVVLDKLPVENDQMRTDMLAPRPKDAPVATSRILSSSAGEHRVYVKAPRYTIVVSSIPWWPGWKVLRNGARIEPLRVNGGFLGFAVPPGEVDVKIWFDPWTFRIGSIVSLLTIIAMIAIARRRSAVT